MKLMNIFLLIILLLGSLTSYAIERTDIVMLNNGDRVTGEIKSLEAGVLKMKTNTMGIIHIEW